MKIRSAFPRTVVWYFCDGREKTEKKQKKNRKKTSVKHIRIRLVGGFVKKVTVKIVKLSYRH